MEGFFLYEFGAYTWRGLFPRTLQIIFVEAVKHCGWGNES